METAVQDILQRYPMARRDQALAILREIQDRCGFLSEDAVAQVSRHMDLPSSTLYGLATFQDEFRFAAPTPHRLEVCCGTSCRVAGSDEVLRAAVSELGIQPGSRSRNRQVRLDTVFCMGLCASGPAVRLDGCCSSHVTAESVVQILGSRRMKGEGGDPS
jgi:NADH:ubiquinone oxidoreductase subunit E